MDGNFHAEHMHMRRPEEDVPLSKGDMFMVSEQEYKLHLATMPKVKQVREFWQYKFALLI